MTAVLAMLDPPIRRSACGVAHFHDSAPIKGTSFWITADTCGAPCPQNQLRKAAKDGKQDVVFTLLLRSDVKEFVELGDKLVRKSDPGRRRLLRNRIYAAVLFV